MTTDESDLPEITLHELGSSGAAGLNEAYEKTLDGPGSDQTAGPPSKPAQVLRRVTADGVTVDGLRIEPGRKLGNYLLLEQIGSGGMATIFKARDIRNERIVAVKALHAQQARSLAGERFKREYRAIRRLAHPNIVQVYWYGVDREQPYIAMEYVDGHDLKTDLKRLRKLPEEERWRQVEDLVSQICLALEEVHSRGIIHRDLKPSNILLTRDHRAKLTDFGVAKPEEVSMQLTQEGMLVGTLAYLAPEVFEQATLDHRIDLYALGVMIYVMLTSRLPFSGKDIAEIMEKHLNHMPKKPRALNPRAPEHLERIVMRLLEKDPERRFQSAVQVLRSLRIRQSAVGHAVLESRKAEQFWVPRLVGRSEQLDVLLSAVSRLNRGQGGIVLVSGPIGVGKSRLVESGLSVARPQGINVYSGMCLAGPQTWGEGFRSIVAAIRADAELGGNLISSFARVVAHYPDANLPAPEVTPEVEGGGLPEELIGLFDALARKSPRILWIDDVDCADEGTLSVLSALSRWLSSGVAPLLLVMTLEMSASSMPVSLRRILRDEIAGAEPVEISLDNLFYGDVDDLMEFMFPSDPRAGTLAKRLYEESKGNPLVLTDSIRFLMSRGRMGRRIAAGRCRWVMSMSVDEIARRIRLPGSTPAIARERLAAYPGHTRTLLRLIAVWGREISFKTMLRLASAPEEALMAHVERLLVDGWLAEDWLGGDERYRLAHPSYRSSLLNQLTPSDKKKLRGFINMRLGLR